MTGQYGTPPFGTIIEDHRACQNEAFADHVHGEASAVFRRATFKFELVINLKTARAA